jgi:Domain of unknown function (DUF4410)
MVVYVSDFELDVVGGKPERRAMPKTSPSSTSAPPSAAAAHPQQTSRSRAAPKAQPSTSATDSQGEDTPAERANALVNVTSESLVEALEKAGYTVRRLHAGDGRPQKGLWIRGVFGEADEQNRVRRLLVGGGSKTPRMLLYVGVNNLAKPEQPVYELANPPSNESGYGPVITVTSYAPVARFELDKHPTGEELKKIASEIAAGLTALLDANPTAVAQ